MPRALVYLCGTPFGAPSLPLYQSLPSTLSILLSVHLFLSLPSQSSAGKAGNEERESESVNRRLLLPAAAQSVRSLTVSRGDLCLRLAQLRPRLLQSCSKFASFGCFGAHAAHTGARVSLTHSPIYTLSLSHWQTSFFSNFECANKVFE